MNLQEKKIFVPVSVETPPTSDLADENNEIYVKAIDDDLDIINAYYEPKDNTWWIPFMGEQIFPKTWLKEETKICLTKEEFQDVWDSAKLIDFGSLDDYKAGAEWGLAEQKQSAVWVKASERLPEENKKVKLRLGNQEYPAVIFHERMKLKWTCEGIEWLDETPQRQLSNEEIEALAEKEYPGKTKKVGEHGVIIREQRKSFIKGYRAATK